jgi:hypothetical protein
MPALMSVPAVKDAAAEAGSKVLPGNETFSFDGTMALNDYWPGSNAGDLCYGDGGYDDMQAGAQVIVADPDGTNVALGRLQPGTLESPYRCVFPFHVDDVPERGSHAIFEVTVSDRGGVGFAREEMTDGVGLTLG